MDWPAGSSLRSIADVAWVVGALAVILGFPNAMTSTGLWALGIPTLAVADFAVLAARLPDEP